MGDLDLGVVGASGGVLGVRVLAGTGLKNSMPGVGWGLARAACRCPQPLVLKPAADQPGRKGQKRGASPASAPTFRAPHPSSPVQRTRSRPLCSPRPSHPHLLTSGSRAGLSPRSRRGRRQKEHGWLGWGQEGVLPPGDTFSRDTAPRSDASTTASGEGSPGLRGSPCSKQGSCAVSLSPRCTGAVVSAI